jgi:hypothetical protein
MADRMLFFGWSGVARGREERALEVFNETVGFYGRLAQEGRIESFDVRFLAPNESLDGYFELHGSAQQIADLKEDAEFMRLTTEASLIIDGQRIIDGVTNQAIAEQMAIYQEALAKIPQRA